MAARTRRISHDENTRAKIQTSQIVNRLTKHVFGELDLTATQIAAALGLLKKSLPDLQSIEMTAEVTEKRVISAEPLSIDEWESRYSSDLASTKGAAEKPH